MSFGEFDQKLHQPMADINVTPMVDVMLVLLVIFIISAPLFANHSIKLNLPQAKATPAQQTPKIITISVNEKNKIFLGEKEISLDALKNYFHNESQNKNYPEIHIRADKDSRYETIAQIMAYAQNSSLNKIGFITSPEEKEENKSP